MALVITGCFILLDLLSGLLSAFKSKSFKSSKMREGLFHKIGSILVIIFGILVDYAQRYVDLGVQVPLTIIICVYIIFMECGSILENACKLNPEINVETIKQYFTKNKERSTKTNGNVRK